MDPKVVENRARRRLTLYDVEFHYGVEAGDSDGKVAMIEVTVPPRTLVKPHMHSKEDEFTLVLEGTIGAALGDDTTDEIPAGSFLVKPRNVRHALWNASNEPARILEVVTPAGLERYFEEVAPILTEHGPEWTQRFYETAGRYGLTVFDDWSKELQARYGITL
jgi:quercetin dioxygenase-like cupin family protein